MSIQQNYPAIKPVLNLDFASTKQLDPRITYSRASTGTYYDAKAVAKAEENLTLQSQAIATSPWTTNNATATNNTAVAPDGTMTAGTLTASATNNIHLVSNQFTTVANTTYTVSFFLKKGTNDFAYVSLSNYAAAGASITAVFDLNTGTVSQTSNGNQGVLLSSSITSSGGGWYRCVITGYLTLANASSALWVGLAPTASGNSFVSTGGISYSAAGTETIFVWGAQLEQRSTATAYTPTTTAPITNYIPVLQTASAGTPRFDHNPITGENLGLLIEEQRTNLLPYSAQLQNTWTVVTDVTFTGNTNVSPDATLTATKMVEGSANSFHGGRYFNLSIGATGSVTFSIYIKAAERRYLYIAESYWGNSCYFDAVTGVIRNSSGTFAATAVGNGWWRLSTNINATLPYVNFQVFLNRTDTFVAGVKDSYSGDNFSGIYIWGAQLEAGAFPTSYIPTALTYSGRASTGTFRGSNGLLQTAGINAPRYEVNAGGGSNLLLEGASSNLLPYTEELDSTAGWSATGGATVSLNNSTAPDGSLTASKLRFIVDDASNQFYRGFTSASAVYTCSIYVRLLSGTSRTIRFGFYDGSNALTDAVTITNSWTRLTSTKTLAASSLSRACWIYPTSGDVLDLQIWGAQLEIGPLTTSYIPSLETFTGRASTATYYDSTGIVRTAASGQPRYSYNPALLSVAPKLLLEAQATNLLTYSEQFDNAAWTKSAATITANTIIAPDGTQTADELIETNATTADQTILKAFNITGVNSVGDRATFSIYVKKANRQYCYAFLFAGNNSYQAKIVFDLNTGLPTQSFISNGGGNNYAYTITSVGNGWYKLTISYTVVSGGFPARIWFGGNPTATTTGAESNSYTGNGIASIYLWGAQLETGSGATSYIPTTASQVTRAADTSTSAAQSRAADVYSSAQVTRANDLASMTGTNFSSWYNQSEGSYFCNYSGPDTIFGIFAMGPGGYASPGSLNVFINTTNTPIYYSPESYPDVNYDLPRTLSGKICFGYSHIGAGSYGAVVNAGSVSSSSGTFSTGLFNSLALGRRDVNGVFLNGHIKKLAYYPRRLTNTQLQALTT